MGLGRKPWPLILAGLLVAGFLTYHYFLSAALSSGCSNNVLMQAASTDGRYVATVFEMNCGATSPFLRVASIRLQDAPFDAKDDKSWVFVTRDRPTVKILWSDQRKLTVVVDGYSSTPPEQRVRSSRWEDVEIVSGTP
jgi:hypothetical protein